MSEETDHEERQRDRGSFRAMQETEVHVEKINTDQRSLASTESLSLESLPLSKIVRLNPQTQLVFARYNSYIMLPWFTISSIVPDLDAGKLQTLVKTISSMSLNQFLSRRVNWASNRSSSIHSLILFCAPSCSNSSLLPLFLVKSVSIPSIVFENSSRDILLCQ